MSKRKIAECVNIRINVGNYQHIELSKYAEEEIEYKDDADRVQQEDALRDDLVASIIRSMKAIPEKLGKGVDNAIEVEQSIKKAMPEWMENTPVPNIANGAERKHIQDTAEQKDRKDSQAKDAKEILGDDVIEDTSTEEVGSPVEMGDVNESDLFEDDSESEDKTEEVNVEPEPVAEKKTKNKSVDEDSFFDDDMEDIFGED